MYGTKDLSNHLRAMAAEAHDMTADGQVLTRGEALALLLWKKALGYTERKVNDDGIEVEVHHEPAAWAQQLIFDRLEGRTPTAIPEDETRVKAADTVSELAKARINAAAAEAADPEA